VIKSEFYNFSKTQFVPLYQSHILIILMWNKVTSHTFQAHNLLCKMWQKQKMSSPQTNSDNSKHPKHEGRCSLK
jgi:hypothetical protein